MNSRTICKRRWLTSLLLLLGLGLLLYGCFTTSQPAVFPEFSRYEYLYTLSEGDRVRESSLSAIEVDGTYRRATLFLNGKEPIISTLSERESQKWPEGCPTNVGSTKMEILDIDKRPLVIGDLTLDRPILVKNCPKASPQVVLREDGQVGGGGNACVGAGKCLVFEMEPLKTSAQIAPLRNAKPLPHAEKGYELYSWFETDYSTWRYALTTGTNRLKSYQEITTEENTITADGWVKITLGGFEALKDILGRLPEGEFIYWRGGAWLTDGRLASSSVVFPADKDIKTIDQYCREHGLNLYLTP